MAQRLLRPLVAALFILAALACLALARRSLAEISRPHDLFALSLLTSSLLACLFLVASGACLLPMHEEVSTGRKQRWLRNLLIPALVLLLSATVIATDTPTSFVTWDQIRGAPLPWLESGHYWGPCFAGGGPCRTYWFSSVRPLPLIVNFGAIGLAIDYLRRLTTRCPAKNAPYSTRDLRRDLREPTRPAGRLAFMRD
jgi:hypothetical protein